MDTHLLNKGPSRLGQQHNKYPVLNDNHLVWAMGRGSLETQTSTLLPGDHVASSIKGHKQTKHQFSLELLQKNPSFCKLVESNQVPAKEHNLSLKKFIL